MPTMSDFTLWAGSEASFFSVQQAEAAALQRVAAGYSPDEDEEDDDPRLLEVMGSVGIVSIHGRLTNSSAWYNELFGISGYPEIRDALVAAANDPAIEHIVLDIDSGGGSVAGVDDTAKLIRTIHDRVKPVTAYTSGTMASAAYWLGSAAGKVYADRMAISGSIGVIAIHMERSKQLKDDGIGVNVIRSGPYKALANGVEPLSEEGRKQLQAQVDSADAVFVEHVATMRGRSVGYTHENLAQGREFVSEEAQRVGLIDGVKTFDVLMSELEEKLIAPSKTFMDNRGNAARGAISAASDRAENGEQQMGRKVLTEQEIAALAAGASLEPSAASQDEPSAATETAAEHEGSETDIAAAAGEGAGTAEAAGDPEAASAASAAAAPQDVAKNDDALKLLKEQLKAAQDDLLEARIEGRKATDKVAEIEAVVSPMAQIVGKAINHMQVALGGTALDLSAMAPGALVAEYTRLVEQFQSKFKVGGVAAVGTAASDKASASVDPFHKARVDAVRFNKKK